MADLELESLGNGDGNNYLLRDNTKIPLSGSSQISGDLIPATDNSIDVGSSTNNIKMLYTKGITIDGKTIDTDANDNMTFNGHIVDTIEEQGEGYIRYSNGLQICWGILTWQSDSTRAWGSLYETSGVSGSYAKSFIEIPFFSASGDVGGNSALIDYGVGTKTTTPQVWLCRGKVIDDVSHCTVRYTAVGMWK